MTNEELEELGKRAVACEKRWRWMPGMLAFARREPPLEPVIQRRGDVNWDPPYPGSIPDLTDPATLGGLLHLVRSRFMHEHVSLLFTGEVWEVWRGFGLDHRIAFSSKSEAEALVAALEAGGAAMTKHKNARGCDSKRILYDMCHAIGLSVYQPHSRSFNAERYRNGYSEGSTGQRPELKAAIDAGFVSLGPIVIYGGEYTHWSVTQDGIEWCWRYILTAKPDRARIAQEFKAALVAALEAAP